MTTERNDELVENLRSDFVHQDDAQACKGYVNFDASSGTPVIQSQLNVASITDNGVGSYTLNLTKPVTVDSAVVGSGSHGAGGNIGVSCSMLTTTTVMVIVLAAAAGTGFDADNVSIIIFGRWA